ncbi:isoliquiritigenin 2'-O-methyltransferase-like [Senna tora]|uniref:Isoliquiritigenin 2'-O-methyltransferase-like n=1 Tax=Senna tora TaxID=362788 RepID=A0A835CA51_9FABA|nr:isoliquiritigenin 2'-O-methyltransferase-like [Senna tora]
MALDPKQNLVHHHEEEGEDSSFLSAMNMCFTHIHSAALNFGIDHKIFDIIAKANGRHVSAIEVASQLQSSLQHQDLAFRLDRVLRLLATQSLLTCSYGVNSGDDTQRERLYGISPIGKFFVSDNENTSGFVAFMSSLMGYPALVDAWLNFKNAIIDKDTDDLYKKVHGIPLYQYLEKDQKLNNLFNKAMENLSFIMMRRTLEVYKGFEGISTLVDVGGGIEHVGGDMFADVPKSDAIILKVSVRNEKEVRKSLSLCANALDFQPSNLLALPSIKES